MFLGPVYPSDIATVRIIFHVNANSGFWKVSNLTIIDLAVECSLKD